MNLQRNIWDKKLQLLISWSDKRFGETIETVPSNFPDRSNSKQKRFIFNFKSPFTVFPRFWTSSTNMKRKTRLGWRCGTCRGVQSCSLQDVVQRRRSSFLRRKLHHNVLPPDCSCFRAHLPACIWTSSEQREAERAEHERRQLWPADVCSSRDARSVYSNWRKK